MKITLLLLLAVVVLASPLLAVDVIPMIRYYIPLLERLVQQDYVEPLPFDLIALVQPPL